MACDSKAVERSALGRRSQAGDRLPHVFPTIRIPRDARFRTRPGAVMHRIVAVFLACAPVPALAQPGDALRDMSTDRPDKTESPYTVDAGHIQIELDLANYTRDDSDGLRTEGLAIVPFNFKLGLDQSTDIQLLVEPFVRQTVTDRVRGGDRIDGIGDVTVRLKHNLWGNDGGPTALALMPFVKLPTNSNGLGNGAVEFGLIVPLAVRVADGIGIGAMTQIGMFEEADGRGYAPSFVNSATVAFDLTDRLGLYTELFTERSIGRGAEWVVTGDIGFTYALSDNIQLDTGIAIGLTDAADDLNLFVGISRRF